MSPAQWREIDGIFHAALDLPADQRHSWLAKVCAGNAALQSAVQRLLTAHDRLGGFLCEPALQVAARTMAAGKARFVQGRRVGNYEVQSLLGFGGMGEVYLARDTRLDRAVALKILSAPPDIDPENLQRFLREARAASALNHPNVATIHDVGEAEGIRFIVMEHVEGETLASKIRARLLTSHEIAEIGIQVASALDAAHRKGITHGDIKPANVMITADGQVKVLDFGLAMVPDGRDMPGASGALGDGGTNAGVLLGTVSYMSPEQVRGESIDHRADIFSLGVMLYEMASGRPPFTRDTDQETMKAILQDEPAGIPATGGRNSRDLERIVLRCLTKDRDLRYHSAREVLVHLTNVRSGHRISGRRLVLGSGVAAILAIGTVGIWKMLPDESLEAPIDSIAVLPLGNGGSDTEYLGEGLAASLTYSFSELPGIRVINRATAIRYAGTTLTPREICEELQVRAVLTGSLSLKSEVLTIEMKLVDDSGAILLNEHYTLQLQDILAVLDQINRQVLAKLHIKLNLEEQHKLTRQYTRSPDAYQLYIKGRYESMKYTQDGTSNGISYLLQAVGLDPQYALAYAGLAEAHMNASGWYMSAREAGPKAKEFAMQAYGLDKSISEAHSMLGWIAASFDRDWRTAEQQFLEAIALNQSSAAARDYYAFYVLAPTRRLKQSLEELRLAQTFDPQSSLIHQDVGQVLYFARRYDESIQELKKAVTLNNDDNFWLARINLGCTYIQKKMYPEALEQFQRTVNALGFPDGPAYVAYGLAMSGRHREALKAIETLKQSRPAVNPWAMAMVYTALDNRDAAFTSLEAARDEHFLIFATFSVDPAFDSLRSDERCAALLRSIGLDT